MVLKDEAEASTGGFATIAEPEVEDQTIECDQCGRKRHEDDAVFCLGYVFCCVSCYWQFCKEMEP